MYHIFSELSLYYGGERNERAAAAAHAKGQNGREKGEPKLARARVEGNWQGYKWTRWGLNPGNKWTRWGLNPGPPAC